MDVDESGRLDPIWKRRDHYDLLEVGRGVSTDDVKRAWRLQQLAWSPDRFAKDHHKAIAQARSKAINAAYETLSDPAKRQRYDLSLPPVEDTAPQFVEPLMNAPGLWKRLAAWMADEDVGEPFNRSIAFKTGDVLERGRQVSDRMKPWALKAWKLGVDSGWDPLVADE
jgi:DnaJ-class molecular chaperone